jgi:PRTRC genetic system protein E
MFQELVPILKAFASVNLILSTDGDNCRLIVIPKPKAENADPVQPFTVAGTAAELDATLPELLSGKYVPSMQHTGNNFHLIKQLEEESRKKLEEKAKAKPKTAPRPATTVAPASASVAAPVKPATPDLFGGGEEAPDYTDPNGADPDNDPEIEEETETDNEQVA